MIKQEPDQINFKKVIVIAFTGLVCLVVIFFAGTQVIPRDEKIFSVLTPPAPRLQVNERKDLARLTTEQNKLLSSYGWIDRDKKIVHVPIERALQQMEQK